MERRMDQEICPPGKWAWPELVGKDGKVAAAIIEKENKNVRAIVVSVNAPRDVMQLCHRVRVVVDENGKVVRTPIIG
ncbi:glu S.griseus protease inhibitor-like [Manihot esculenta]|uniref:Uncharacterized protein n=1 Tax=Manihot esculenta TaxID=3983 RepID=A0ACB7HMI5_MANES|nr:glu S.griseus protease inhibitor-like [Manihot esculenta]KAG8653957.1 hypothetical protein MANES_05G086346v8 [Manihot esculenta]